MPINGFKNVRGATAYTASRPRRDPNNLPHSHTCFNRPELPPYEDYEDTERKLCFCNAQRDYQHDLCV